MMIDIRGEQDLITMLQSSCCRALFLLTILAAPLLGDAWVIPPSPAAHRSVLLRRGVVRARSLQVLRAEGSEETEGGGSMPVMPESAEGAWKDPIIQAEAREILIGKYLEKEGITLEYAEKEVDEYLADYDRSGQYCLNLAFSKQPGGLTGDPGQLSFYLGALLAGFFGSIALKVAVAKLFPESV